MSAVLWTVWAATSAAYGVAFRSAAWALPLNSFSRHLIVKVFGELSLASDRFNVATNSNSPSHLQITRAEVVAFFNTMHRLSESLAAIERFREMLAQRKVSAASPSSYSPVEQKATHVTPSLDVPKSPVPNPTFDVKTPPTSYREVSLNRHAPERFKKPMAVWDSRPKSGKANVFVRNSNLAEEGGIYEVLKDLSRTLWRLIRQRRPRAKSNKDEL